MRWVWAILLVAAGSTGALAERLVSTISNPSIDITSSFSGATLSIFGNIEPDRAAGESEASGPYQVIIVVEGPLTGRVARQKTSRAGIWINTDQVVFQDFPTFFHVLSSDRPADITDIVTLTIEQILPEDQARQPEGAGWYKSAVFGREVVRLMTETGLFGVNEQGVKFLSGTAFSARLALPGNVPNGRFITRTYVFRNGLVVARGADGFTVRKSGFERFLGLAAVQQPVLYGIAGVILALGTGWLGGVIFRR